MLVYDTIIIGAGAAGLLCAIEAGNRNRTVLLLDKAEKAAKKILISGGGRCNFTNLTSNANAYLSRNPHFCKSALARYTQWDFIALVEKHGLSWTEKTLGQLFCDQKSKAIVEMLIAECKDADVNIQTNCIIEDIQKDHALFTLKSSIGKLQAQSLVIATGGPSIPRMGSTDFGIRISKQFGLKNIAFTPALVPFTFPQVELDDLFKPLAGTSTEVEVSTHRQKISFREAMLFTHRGLSGPAILQISSYWQKGDRLYINLFPDNDALSWLEKQQNQHPKTELKTRLNQHLPKKLAHKLCEKQLTSKPMQQYSPTEIEYLASQLSHWELIPSGTEGMRTAEVCTGGVDTDELSSKTFESKKVAGLYFIGETIDVTGHLGGYNFQWAWSSGWCAGQFV
ncbi:MAG TPA: NAD(P)/FAD-dependent oxidoreductase [Leucothrix mucor]|uniref:NAD(P)/FAD-dependent oxidoreductase n=1 Tax=Leucothrix mucor TaxID=45248 RepID=A0A7V2SYD3_LEUMU|nr:NAD(P)/FAD-dependent oxidoreductase [Leucothrix mucor]